jgi:catechol 2,3-dioxygenase-like lactoylglutathione lyase family enzyme
MTRDLWHVGLVVSDLEKAIAFYELLGLELRLRQEQANAYTASLVGYEGASLRIAQMRFPSVSGTRSGHLVELIQYVHPVPDLVEPANARIGAAHVAFEVDGIDALRATLEAAGAVFLSDANEISAGVNRGGRAVYLRDPDGITLELVEPPARP